MSLEEHRARRALLWSFASFVVALAALVLALSACGDDLHPPAPDASVDAPYQRPAFTYDDFYHGWAQGYCSFAERCFPYWVYTWHRNETDCAGDVEANMCNADPFKCVSAFMPDAPVQRPIDASLQVKAIVRCAVDSAELPCAATGAPVSCDR